MENQFLNKTSLIGYNKDFYNTCVFAKIDEIQLNIPNQINWLNTYGLHFFDEYKTIINNNQLDDFLIKLLGDENHSNKVSELDNAIFITIKVLKTETINLESERIFFIISEQFIWTIQQRKGDYFEWIRTRLRDNKGIVRNKKADYLLYLLLESIIDNYEEAYKKLIRVTEKGLENINTKPTPDFAANIEKEKQIIYSFKKATTSLRDTITKLEKIQNQHINTKFYNELKEQINNHISEIEFDLQELESKINLIFSFQGHHLNEVMKTLTIFSVIFIPLTFIAGIYGMNFKYMPELDTKYGYFILLGAMVVISVTTIIIFKRKKWF